MISAEERPVETYQIEYGSRDEAIALSVALAIARLTAEDANPGEGEEERQPEPKALVIADELQAAQNTLLAMLREQYVVTELGGGTATSGPMAGTPRYLVSDVDNVASVELLLEPGGVRVDGPAPQGAEEKVDGIGVELKPALARWRALRLHVLQAWEAIRSVMLPLNY